MIDVYKLVCEYAGKSYSNLGLCRNLHKITLRERYGILFSLIVLVSSGNQIALRRNIHGNLIGVLSCTERILFNLNVQISLLDNSNILADCTIFVNRYMTRIFQRGNSILFSCYVNWVVIFNSFSRSYSLTSCRCSIFICNTIIYSGLRIALLVSFGNNNIIVLFQLSNNKCTIVLLQSRFAINTVLRNVSTECTTGDRQFISSILINCTVERTASDINITVATYNSKPTIERAVRDVQLSQIMLWITATVINGIYRTCFELTTRDRSRTMVLECCLCIVDEFTACNIQNCIIIIFDGV